MDLTLAGALITGLATSLHCAGMCGPLACGVGTFAKSESERMTAASLYPKSLKAQGIAFEDFLAGQIALAVARAKAEAA